MQFVASAFNDGINEKMVEDFIAQFKPAFPLGWNTRVAVWAFVQYSVLSQRPLYVPHMVFIDREGVIRAEYKGEESFFQAPGPNIRKELDKMLAAAHGAPAKRAPRKK